MSIDVVLDASRRVRQLVNTLEAIGGSVDVVRDPAARWVAEAARSDRHVPINAASLRALSAAESDLAAAIPAAFVGLP